MEDQSSFTGRVGGKMSNLNSFNRLTEFPRLETQEKSDGILSKFFWWKKADIAVGVETSQAGTSASVTNVDRSNRNGEVFEQGEFESFDDASGGSVTGYGRSGSSMHSSGLGPASIGSNISDTSSTLGNSQSPDLLDMNASPFTFEARTVPTVLKRISSLIASGTTNQNDMKKYWMPDSVSKECYECAEKFTTFRRKHHCRICGQIFCSRCCNREIPGKIVGYAGDLRVCTYCSKIVSSYLQVSDTTDDLKGVVQEELQNRFGAAEGSHSSAGLYSPLSFDTPPNYRSLPRRKISVGYQEERFATSRGGPETIFDSMGGGVVTEDKQSLKALWEEMTHPVTGMDWATHRHNMMKNYHSCVAGSEIVDWLMRQRKVKTRMHGMNLGQLLIESSLLECVSQAEQVFQDAYVLYRQLPLAPVIESPELENGGDGTDYGPSRDTQDPLWVTQISTTASTITSDERDSATQPVIPEAKSRLPSVNSNYSLDLNVSDNTVFISKPKEEKFVDSGAISQPSLPEPLPPTEQRKVLSGSGSEMMTDEFLRNTLLQQKDQNKVTTPPIGWHSPQQLTTDEDILAFQRLCNAFVQHENDILNQLLSSMNLSQEWADVILPIVQKVTEVVKPDLKYGDDQMDIRQYVQFKKLSGGSKKDCRIVNGVVCSKNIANRAMSQRLKDPKILLIGSAIDYQRDEEKLLSLETLVMQEHDYSRNAVARIASLQPDLVLVEKSVSRTAQDLMLGQGITLVINVKPSVMERVARCTQAAITSQYSANTQIGIGKPQLGLCHNFYIEAFELGNGIKKNLMFFDGCAMHLGCTVLLRGGSELELMKVKKIISVLTFVSYNWRLERSFHIDSYALPPDNIEAVVNEVPPSASSSCEDDYASAVEDNESRTPSTPGESIKKEISKFDDPLQAPVLSPTAETLACPPNDVLAANTKENTENEFSDAMKKVYLSASPFIKQSLPYLETEAGRKCELRKFFPQNVYWSKQLHSSQDSSFDEDEESKFVENDTDGQLDITWKEAHFFTRLTITLPYGADEISGSLSEFRRSGGRLHFSSTIENFALMKQKRTYSPSRTSANGRVDALDLFQHQKLPVLFFSFSRQSSIYPSFCVDPWVVNMEFYGRNDISLGMFLEKYCFRKVYKCPRVCGSKMLVHIRRFVHREGCVEVAIKELQNSIDESGRNILMWSCCSRCKSYSPIVTMSSDAWCMSFAKYLELRFHGEDYKSRGCERCTHSLHQAHVHYFAQGNTVSSFAYSKIILWEIGLPETKLRLRTHPKSLPELIDDVKSVAIIGHGVHSSIQDALNSLREACSSVRSEVWNDLSEKLKREKADFKCEIEQIQINLSRPTLGSGAENTKEINAFLWGVTDSIGFLRSKIAETVQNWNAKLQEYILLRKKEEKQTKTSTSTKTESEFYDTSLKSNKTEYDNLPSSTSAPSTISGSISAKEFDESLKSSEQDAFEDSGSTVDMSISGVLEELVSNSDHSSEAPRPDSYSGLVSSGNIEKRSPSQERDASSRSRPDQPERHHRSFGDSSTGDGDNVDSKVKTSSVKTIMSHFLSSSGTGQLLQSPWLGSEHHFIRASSSLPVTVYENEPSSLAAFALCSDEYTIKLNELTKGRQVTLLKTTDDKDSNVNTGSSAEGQQALLGSQGTEAAAAKQNAGDGECIQNVEVQFMSGTARFYCRVYFAEEFRQLRQLCLKESEQSYIRSISRCAVWNATGGKSGLTFCKTLDDRFVVKQMSKYEIQSFLAFAPNYFQYVSACLQENKPTVLAKILGVYRIGFKNSATTAQSKMDILVMENLFYDRNISLKFDLKGSERNRLATSSGKEEEVVLLDENLINRTSENPLYIRPHTKTVLTTALSLDSAFLASQSVMDYSLLVGFDSLKKELVVGIIDYIRTYTIDKKIETFVKSSGILGGQGKAPTVVSPNQYQARFTQAMDRYFLMVPDRWMGLGLGVDS